MAAFMKMNGFYILMPLPTLFHLSLILLIWLWIIMVELRLQTQKHYYLWFPLALFWSNMKYSILRNEKDTTKVAVLQLLPVYCIPNM